MHIYILNLTLLFTNVDLLWQLQVYQLVSSAAYFECAPVARD